MMQVFNLLGGLALFLYGMKLLSAGLQKLAGNNLRTILEKAASNRVSAAISGALVTGIIQSSSATTVITVGFVSAGLLTLFQAVGIIFGANIGTTLTAWIVSIFGFKFDISLFALPAIALGFFAQCTQKWLWVRRSGEALLGFGLLFFGLAVLKQAIPTDFSTHPQVVAWLSQLSPNTFLKLLLLIITGTVLTVILQSSSAVMAMTLTCAAAGIIDFPTACSLVLGENIGTTITANLAALNLNRMARRAALSHTLFNLFGVIWATLLFHQLTHFVDVLVPGNPNSSAAALSAVLPYHIAAFHTLFNVLNTLILLPLLPYIVNLTYWILPKLSDEHRQELVYLSAPFTAAPELAFLAVRKESARMINSVVRILGKLMLAVKMPNKTQFYHIISPISQEEALTDTLEKKITAYLTLLAHENISRHATAHALEWIHIVNHIEKMADCGEKVSRILEKFYDTHLFTKQDQADLQIITRQVHTIVKHTYQLLAHPISKQASFHTYLHQERELNAMRKRFLHERRQRILNGQQATPDDITAYSDILGQLEQIGDYAFHIDEFILGIHVTDKETHVHEIFSNSTPHLVKKGNKLKTQE